MELFKLYGEIALNGGDNALRQLRGIDQAGQKTGGVLKSLAMQAVGVAAGFGLWTSVSAAVNGMKNLGQQAIMLNANLEQSKVAFATFLGSVKEGNAFIEDMRRFAAKTPFQYTELEQYAKRLLAFKFEAKDILPMMTAIGNAASGLGGGAEVIGRISMALGQMKVKGRVMSEEMLQLTEAGIGAWDILAKGIGKSTAEVQKMVQQGLVPADEAIKILTAGMNEQFDNMMDKQSQTMMGLWSTIKDVGEMVLTDVGEGVFGELKKAVSGVAGSLEQLQSSGQLRQWAQGLGESLGRLAEILGTVSKVGAGVLTTFVAWKAITGIPAGIAMVTSSMVALRGAMVATAAVGMNFWTAMKIASGGQAAAFAFVTAGRAVSGLAAQQRAAAAASVALAEAQNMVKAALVSTGIGVLVVALGALVTYLMMAKSANEKFIESIEKEIKARDGKRTQLEAEMSQRESEIKQLEELKGKYVETDKALNNAKKGSEEATVAKAKLAQMTQELIPLIGEEGAEHIRSANDSAKAFDAELKAKASQVTQIKGKIEEAVRADAAHTITKIQSTQARIESLKNETKAYGLWANMLVWVYNRAADINRVAATMSRGLGMKKEAAIYELGAKYWDEKSANRAAASREAELDKLYDKLGNLTSRYRDLSSYSLDAGKAVESVGPSAAAGMQKAGKAAKDAAEEIKKAWDGVVQQVESAMSGVSNIIGTQSELDALEFKNRIGDIIAQATDLGDSAQPLIGELRAALLQVNDTVMSGSEQSWMELLNRLRNALHMLSDTAGSEARLTADKISVIYGRAVEAAQKASERNAEKALESAQRAYSDIVSSAKNAFEQEQKLLKEKYDQAKKTYDGILERARKTYDAIVKAAQQARDSKVAELQRELDAIDEAEEKREREATTARLQENIKAATTAKEKAQALKEWDKWLHDEEIRLKKETLRKAIEAANDEYESKKRAAEEDLQRQIGFAEGQLRIEQERYNEGLRMAGIYYNYALSAAQTYYKNLGYSIDEVTGKLTKQRDAAKEAGNAINGQTPAPNQGQTTKPPSGETQSSNIEGGNQPSWRPVAGTELRNLTIPGVTITPYNENAQWYFRFSSSKGTWTRQVSTIPGTSLINGKTTITNGAEFYDFIKVLIPGYARGTSGHKGGPALVGEEGPEIVDLPPGTTVIPNKKTIEILKSLDIPAYADGTEDWTALLNTPDDQLSYSLLRKKYRQLALDRSGSYYYVRWGNNEPEYYWAETEQYIGNQPPTPYQTVLYNDSRSYDTYFREGTMIGNHILESVWQTYSPELKQAYLDDGDTYVWKAEGQYIKNPKIGPQTAPPNNMSEEELPPSPVGTPSGDNDKPPGISTPGISTPSLSIADTVRNHIKEELSGTLKGLEESRDVAVGTARAKALEDEIVKPGDKRVKLEEAVSVAEAELTYADESLKSINTAIQKAAETYGENSPEVKGFSHQLDMAKIAFREAQSNLTIAQRELTQYDEQTGQWSDELSEAKTRLSAINTSLDAANTVFAAAKKAVDDANSTVQTYQKQLSDLSQTNITGTRAYDTARHERDQKTAELDLQILEERTTKAKGYRKRIKALEKQKQEIETENQKAALQYELSIGDQQWKLRQLLDDAKEMSFKELTTAITQTKQQITTAQGTLTAAQAAMKDAGETVTKLQDLKQKQENFINVLGTVFTTLKEKLEAIGDAYSAIPGHPEKTISWSKGGMWFGPDFTPTRKSNQPRWPEVRTISVSVPKDAQGGIAISPRLSIWGEAGPEALIPLDRLPGILMESLTAAALKGGHNLAAHGAGEINMTFEFSGPISVRNDNDLRQMSREIYNLAENTWRARGVK